MSSLKNDVDQFLKLLTSGNLAQAAEAYYAEDINVFENQKLVRAGLKQCIKYEREQMEHQQTPPKIGLRKVAINEPMGHVFLEYTLRFTDLRNRPMRIDEVAVQTWEGGKISEERFYHKGLIDEGDE